MEIDKFEQGKAVGLMGLVQSTDKAILSLNMSLP